MTRSSSIIEFENRPIPSKTSRLNKALIDIISGIGMWRIWLMLGWQDVRLRYRRSQLGPFWITLSMALTVYTLSFLYSHLWKISYHEYMLYFACGLLSWNLIVTIVNESTNIFIEAKPFILQVKLPYTIFIMRILFRNFIVFLHNFLAIIPLLLFFHSDLNWHILLIFPIFLLVSLPIFCFSFLFAIIGLRYRDIAQFITNMMNLIFFFTPIMWLPKNLPPRLHFLIDYNPLAQFVNLMRAPLMGNLPTAHEINSILCLFLVGFCLLLWCFSKVRHRIVFWL